MALEVNKNEKYKIEEEFQNLLNETRAKKGKPSHTGVGKNNGRFLIEGIQLKQFFILLGKMMQAKIDSHIIEQHTDIGPFIIDIDLRLPFEQKKRIYGYSFIKKFCEVYIKYIIEYFDLNNQDKNELVRAFVFERPNIVIDEEKKIVKDGIHIMFPYIVSEPAIQNIIREHVIKELEEYYKSFPFTNTISNAIDKRVIDQVGWYMYGSTKPGVPRYELKYIFDQSLNQVDIKLYNEYQLPSLLSIRNKTETIPIKETKLEEVNNFKMINTKTKHFKKKESTTLSENDITEIFELVDILHISRADDYDDWRNLGFALHSIEPNNDDLLSIFDNFSQKSPKYDPSEVEKFWHSIKTVPDGINLGSIHFWAKLDNPEKYAEFRNGQTRTFIEQSETGTNVDIAKVLYKLYKYQFVCASLKNNKWYKFYRHQWEEDELGIELRNKISNELVLEYCKLITHYNNVINLDEDKKEVETDKKKKFDLDARIKNMEKKIERFLLIIKNLKTTSFIDNVMKECRGLFYDKDFMDKLDENHYLFSFKNGVLDLKTGQFRDGRPEDFISLCCGVNYVQYKENLPHMEEIKDFLYKVMPDPDDRKYMITLMSSLLEGHNADESFHFWTGSGGNGKSKVNSLLVEAFGGNSNGYTNKFPITLFTGKRGASNSVSPEVIESKGKRYAYLEEPSEGESINVGLMKEYSGGDKIKGRGLFQGNKEFKPQFKLILFCNDMPKLPPDDNGTWRRVKALEFKSSFVANPKNEYEFLIDKYLADKIPMWAESFMSLLVNNYFEVYKKNGLEIPQSVIKFTSEYQKDMDLYIDFVTTKLIKTDKKTDKLSLTSIHDKFKVWFTQTYNCPRFPIKKDLKKYLEKKFSKAFTGNHLVGFIWNDSAEDSEFN